MASAGAGRASRRSGHADGAAALRRAQLLPLQKVEPNPLQPRKSFDPDELQALADSIAMHGIIQPLTVRQLPSGFYQIIAGERRWRAARLAGLDEVPVVVIEADDKKAMELALIENLQRSDLNPIEEAKGYQQLMTEYGMTQEVTAERVGKSRPAVANALRLLSLSPAVLELVEQGETFCRTRAGASDRQIRAGAVRRGDEGHQFAALRPADGKYVQKSCKGHQAQAGKAHCGRLSGRMRKNALKRLGRGVRIVSGKRKGRLELEYYGEEDLQRLYELLERLS